MQRSSELRYRLARTRARFRSNFAPSAELHDGCSSALCGCSRNGGSLKDLRVLECRPHAPRPCVAPVRNPATTTRAFLFSDLRDYTSYVEAKGDAAAAKLLRAYRTLIRREVARHSGTEVKPRATRSTSSSHAHRPRSTARSRSFAAPRLATATMSGWARSTLSSSELYACSQPAVRTGSSPSECGSVSALCASISSARGYDLAR